MAGRPERKAVRTVWIYTDTTKRGGDEDQLRVFESPGAFERWKATQDPEAVAFEYVVIESDTVWRFPRSVSAQAVFGGAVMARAQPNTVEDS
jgi:hypothetical protein